jgi:hypothetical protein
VTRPMPTTPRGAPPVPPAKPMTPRAPAVAPAVPVAPAVGLPRSPMASTTAQSTAGKKLDSEPPPGGWDSDEDADTVTSFPEPSELPAPTPRNLPPVKASPAPAAGTPATQASPPTAVPATPHSPGTMRGPYQTSPGVGGPPIDPAVPAARAAGAAAVAAPAPTAAARTAGSAASAMAASAGLGSAMREEVWAIVRAAVEEAMGPLVARQRELEARVERAERFADAAKGGARPVGAGIPTSTAHAAPPGASSSAASRLAALGPAISIPVVIGPSIAPVPFTATAPPLPRIEAAHGSATVPDLKAPHPVGPRPSLPPTDSYGVTVMPSMRPSLDLDAVGAVDISGFDGGRRKRMVGRAVVVIMLLIITGVVTMTLLSHN